MNIWILNHYANVPDFPGGLTNKQGKYLTGRSYDFKGNKYLECLKRYNRAGLLVKLEI